ncbi:MAG: arsenate reductase family protein [Methylobacteriaceae bacterium]|nr:arsenate reductase family protein [Rhodoblastus sp.]MCC0005790.1 arsenate reductase family protein [Methylobacteriaceae bacterium]
MSNVIFYEKPGCATNARQKAALAAAGHSVDARSLLSAPWTGNELLSYFVGLPVAFWFNKASPRIKSGAFDPAAQTQASAIAAMLADPLLIRRPLIAADGVRRAGFDNDLVARLVGDSDVSSVQGCAHGDAAHSACPAPGISA